ncbi:MAG: type II secretion system protein [Spirochaetia bacterium]|nr:MAG: type II secretion system protein [Spirochaetia bacterium]
MKNKNLNPLRAEKINNGFTMIELLVAMGLFVILMGIATGGFIRTLRTQKAVVALMAANDNASLTLEQMTREIRTGYHFIKLSETEFQFVNADNVIVFYRFNEEAIERGTSDALLLKTYKKITADNIRINRFKINLLGDRFGDGYSPRITINISVTGVNNYLGASTDIQTTISSRVLDS